MSKLLDLYRSILSMGNLVADDEGYISMVLGGEKKPAIVKGKRLVLPTKKHLANPDWKERVAFHPMSENILRGESDVLEKFRAALNIRMNVTLAALSMELLTIAASPGTHAKLTPDQSEFLSKVKTPDEKTLDALKKVIGAMPLNQTTKAFVSIYLKRGGSVGGRKHSRVGVVTFPLYNELKKEGDDVYGVKMRVKDRTALIQLLEYIIPDIDKPEAYNRGSDSQQAPYLDALMRAVGAVASPINDVVEMFRKHLDKADELEFDDEWVQAFDNLDALTPEVRAIPMQAGNEGAVPRPEVAQPAAAVQPQATVAAAPPPSVWSPPTAPYPAGFGQPTVTTGSIGPAVPRTNRGIDFEALTRTNPVLAQQFGGGPFQQQGFVQPQPSHPRWAAPGQVSGWGAAAPGWGGAGGMGGGWGAPPAPGWGGAPGGSVFGSGMRF